ncbi:MAG: hypothetical protein PHG06_18995 [Parabacteroides sp.]|nr:hypothetical protein [Parabacteroides sp.]
MKAERNPHYRGDQLAGQYLAVAVAISIFELESGASLATTVGVLVEVPMMLMLVRIANNTRRYFPQTQNS